MSSGNSNWYNTFIERELRFQELKIKIELQNMLFHINYDSKTRGNGIFSSIQEPKWVKLEKFKETVKNYKV